MNQTRQTHGSKAAFVFSLMAVAALFAVMMLGQRGITQASENEVLDAVAAQVHQVVVRPGDDVPRLVRSHPAGTTFMFEPGLYRLISRLEVETNDSFIGRDKGVVLNGGRILTNWQRDSNGRYYVTGQSQAGILKAHPDWKPCESGYERCIHPEDLFINRVPSRHVTAYDKLGHGKWFFDYDNDRIYLYDDPNGKVVETSVTDFALIGLAHNVTIRNITVEMFASPTQIGAIQANGSGDNLSTGWVIDNVTAQLNHGIGINLIGHRHRITNSRMNNNALKGFGAGGTTTTQGEGIIVENNEFAYNNWGRAAQGFDCCGLKMVRTDNAIIRGNVAHHNYGKGIWTDIDNRNVLIERNIAYKNVSNGIYHEISWNAIIRDNWAGYNGEMDSDGKGVYHAQIMVVNSSNVEITGNIVVLDGRGNGIGLQQNTRSEENGLRFGKPRTNNVWVHHNNILFTKTASNGNMGLSATMEQDGAFRPGNNRFDYNVYHVVNDGDMSNKRFIWRSGSYNDVHMDWTGFRASGQEINGQLIVGLPTAMLTAPLQPWAQSIQVAPVCDQIIVQAPDGESRQDIARLKHGDQYELDVENYGKALNVVAVCDNNTESVRFDVNGVQVRGENAVPYDLIADQPMWVFEPGTYIITMTPADRDNGQGFVGSPLQFTLTLLEPELYVGPVPETNPTLEPTRVPSPLIEADPVPDTEDTIVINIRIEITRRNAVATSTR